MIRPRDRAWQTRDKTWQHVTARVLSCKAWQIVGSEFVLLVLALFCFMFWICILGFDCVVCLVCHATRVSLFWCCCLGVWFCLLLVWCVCVVDCACFVLMLKDRVRSSKKPEEQTLWFRFRPMLIWTKYQILNASTVEGIYDWISCVDVLCLLISLIVLLFAQSVRPHHANRARAC